MAAQYRTSKYVAIYKSYTLKSPQSTGVVIVSMKKSVARVSSRKFFILHLSTILIPSPRRDYIRFYHLRAYDRINAPISFIQEMEKNSGVKFHQAQIAQARLWIGDDSFWHQEKVQIKAPLPDTGLDPTGMGVTEKTKDAQKTVEEVDMPKTTQEASEIVARFQNGATREDEGVADNVGQHALTDRTRLGDEKWYGTEQEERDA
jgi:phospholipase D1/2